MNKQEPDKQIGMDEAEQILLGADPTETWSLEERERVEAIMKTLTPPEPQPVVDLRKRFKSGQTFRDTAGIRMIIRTVGKEAMNISVLGKKGRFVDGHGVALGGFLFSTSRSRKRDTTLMLKGIQQQQQAEVEEPE